jgi:hypothetical protein
MRCTLSMLQAALDLKPMLDLTSLFCSDFIAYIFNAVGFFSSERNANPANVLLYEFHLSRISRFFDAAYSWHSRSTSSTRSTAGEAAASSTLRSVSAGRSSVHTRKTMPVWLRPAAQFSSSGSVQMLTLVSVCQSKLPGSRCSLCGSACARV